MELRDNLPIYRCPRIAGEIAVDARLDKPAWRTAPIAFLIPTTTQLTDPWDQSQSTLYNSDFLRTGAPTPNAQRPTPTMRPTAFATCWSATHLYIAFRCLDNDIWGSYRQRDDPLYDEEVVEVFLCPTGDLRHYYEFEVSPRNVIFDATVFSPNLHRSTMQVDTTWNCPGLQTTVNVNGSLGTGPSTLNPELSTLNQDWTVELAIPFAAFPEVQAPKPGDKWRANFYRIDRADPPEFSAWSPTREIPANFHVPEKFGWLLFVE